MEKTDIEIRGTEAAERFLKHRGYKIIGWGLDGTADLIADDGETVAFVKVAVSEGKWPDEKPVSREAFEDSILRFLEERADLVGRRVRCDMIKIAVMGSNRASIRHHIDCLDDGPLTNLEWLAKHDPATLLNLIDSERHEWLKAEHYDGTMTGEEGEPNGEERRQAQGRCGLPQAPAGERRADADRAPLRQGSAGSLPAREGAA